MAKRTEVYNKIELSEKLFLIKVLLHPANQCFQANNREKKVLREIRKDIKNADH